MTEVMTEAVVIAEAAPRAPFADYRSIRGGSVVSVSAAGAQQDATQDVPMYFDCFVSGTDRSRWNGYLLRDADGEAETWVTDIAAERIMSVINPDHYTYKQGHKWLTAAGKFAIVAPQYLPVDFRERVQAESNKRMPRYKTAIEVLAVTDERVATVRVFTNESADENAVEFGTVELPPATAADIMSNCNLMTADDFRTRFGLASELWPVASVHTYDSKTFVVVSVKGDVATFDEVDDETAEVMPGRGINMTTEYSRVSVKVADSLQAMKDAMPTGEALEALMLLSRNTVTRALKHADSNNYCSETAVALTSAGHVMPEVRIKGTITIPVDVSSKEYMLLRRMFGLANGDVSNLDAVLKQHYSTIAENVRELPKVGKLPAGAVMDLKTEVVFKAPKLRPLA